MFCLLSFLKRKYGTSVSSRWFLMHCCMIGCTGVVPPMLRAQSRHPLDPLSAAEISVAVATVRAAGATPEVVTATMQSPFSFIAINLDNCFRNLWCNMLVIVMSYFHCFRSEIVCVLLKWCYWNQKNMLLHWQMHIFSLHSNHLCFPKLREDRLFLQSFLQEGQGLLFTIRNRTRQAYGSSSCQRFMQ